MNDEAFLAPYSPLLLFFVVLLEKHYVTTKPSGVSWILGNM